MAESIRVGADFAREFPGADPRAAEVAANLVRTATAFLDEVERRRRPLAGLSASAYEALAILEGAGEPLPGHVIAERLLVTTASVTSLLDTLVRRGFVTREPHPVDRRKILVRLTADGQRVVDEMLPIVHLAATDVFGAYTPVQAEELIARLTDARRRLAELADRPPPTPRPRNRRRRTLADAD